LDVVARDIVPTYTIVSTLVPCAIFKTPHPFPCMLALFTPNQVG